MLVGSQCQGFGAIPATLAEYDLDAWDNLDFYDVSMVDGSNLPMYINQFGGRGKDPISRERLLGCRLHQSGGLSSACCRSGWAEPWSAASRPAHVLGPTSTAAGENGRAAPACNPKRWPVDYAGGVQEGRAIRLFLRLRRRTSVFTC